MISFIIPAHNEQSRLSMTLKAIDQAISACSIAAEIIVVNDASTDHTESIAREHGATVINVQHRQIAATRNSGGQAAQGEVLFFVDADTIITAEAVIVALQALKRGAVGGGFLVQLDGDVPWWGRLALPLAIAVCRRLKTCGGACLFCTTAAFEDFGGFDERYYAAEDLVFVRSLKKLGRFVVPQELLLTSARKFTAMSFFRILPLFLRLVLIGPESFQSRKGLEHWYSQAVR